MYKRELERLLSDKKLQAIVRELPDEMWFYVFEQSLGYCFEIQAPSQAEVQQAKDAIKSQCPGLVWKREVYNGEKWKYTAKNNFSSFKIYAVEEAPPQCRAIVEEIEVEEKVPVEVALRKVKKQVITGWDCGKPNGGDKNAAQKN